MLKCKESQSSSWPFLHSQQQSACNYCHGCSIHVNGRVDVCSNGLWAMLAAYTQLIDTRFQSAKSAASCQEMGCHVTGPDAATSAWPYSPAHQHCAHSHWSMPTAYNLPICCLGKGTQKLQLNKSPCKLKSIDTKVALKGLVSMAWHSYEAQGAEGPKPIRPHDNPLCNRPRSAPSHISTIKQSLLKLADLLMTPERSSSA